MPIDDRTTNLNLPKPNADNLLSDDVTRLRDALDAIDTAVFGKLDKAILADGEDFIPYIEVRAASTANVASLSGAQTIDGVALVAGDLVLLKNQTTGSQNGVYVVSAGAWARSGGYNTDAEIRQRTVIVIADGTTNKAGYAFVATNTAAITVDTTAITIAQSPRSIGTAATQAAAGNHTHTSIGTTAASTIGHALSLRYTSRTATATAAATDLVVVFSGSTASQIETLPTGVAVTNNSGRFLRYINRATVDWTVKPASTDTLNGGALGVGITLKAGHYVDVYNTALNTWVVIAYGKLTDPDIATASTLGLIKVGSGLSGDGTLSAIGGGGGTGVPAFNELTITPTSNGQTVFTPAGGYSVGQIELYVNGVLLYGNGDDYTASNGTTITLVTGVQTTDMLLLRRWTTSLSLPFSALVDKPTTVSGYGITDAVTPDGTENLTNKTMGPSNTLIGISEKFSVSASQATGTVNMDVNTTSIMYFTGNASDNWTLNIRGNATTSLDSIMGVGESITVTFLATQGTTAYYANALKIDGVTKTPKYQGGAAWKSGNASSVDAYTYTVIKTGGATFTVFASQSQFA